MADLEAIKEELVTANRILANERIVDSFGHVSIRHPERPNHFLLSRARAPQRVEAVDIMEFVNSTGDVVGAVPGKPYSERFIHGAIYEARPDVMAVVHNHSTSVIPFTVTNVRLQPLMHMAGPIGNDINVWDSRTKFGDTNLLVTSQDMARDLAVAVGQRRVTLMRGHGCVVMGQSLREAVFTAIYLEINAEIQFRAASMGNEINFLSDGEVGKISKGRAGFTLERAWENWATRAGRPYVPKDWNMGEGFSKTDR